MITDVSQNTPSFQRRDSGNIFITAAQRLVLRLINGVLGVAPNPESLVKELAEARNAALAIIGDNAKETSISVPR